MREYVEHDHYERNHQGLGNVVLLPLGQPRMGAIRRHERLGGLPNHYQREAALHGPIDVLGQDGLTMRGADKRQS